MRLAACLVCLLAFCLGFTQEPYSQTHHTITLHGASLAYTATAGYIPLKNATGEIEAQVFYVAYTKDGADQPNRPLTFSYNGGPGSSSLWLHMGCLGPIRANLNDDGTMPKPPFRYVPNEDTWLDATDVVMIDAVGTGLSYPSKDVKKFFGLNGDLDGFAEFIRLYLTQNKRWTSPLYLAGESYGGTRTAGLSDRLLSKGIALSGAIMISGSMNFQTLDVSPGNDLPYILYLPTYAADAWYHDKLSARLQKDLAATAAEVEAWANSEYTVALQKGDSLSPTEVEHIAAKLSEYTGLSKDWIKRAHLRILDNYFYRELLRDQQVSIGRLDGRITGGEPNGITDSPQDDPSGTMIYAPYATALNQYLLTDLRFTTEREYQIYGNVYPWKFDEGHYPDTSDLLRQALTKNPHMRVFCALGYFDAACVQAATKYSFNHMNLTPQQHARVEYHYYTAGHMMYVDKTNRAKLHQEVVEFIARN